PLLWTHDRVGHHPDKAVNGGPGSGVRSRDWGRIFERQYLRNCERFHCALHDFMFHPTTL
ncbi:MAG: hypothetical protein WCR20_10695, partial [Verrucomicrobiota bacterium]